MRRAGHVLNPIAKAVLFDSDVDAFESELQDLSFEEQELGRWRKQRPTAKLHIVVNYITASPQRVEAFEDIQRKNTADGNNFAPLKLVKDNLTRSNSFDDCAGVLSNSVHLFMSPLRSNAAAGSIVRGARTRDTTRGDTPGARNPQSYKTSFRLTTAM